MNACDREPVRVDVRGALARPRFFAPCDHEVQHEQRPTAVGETRPLFVEHFARAYSVAGEDCEGVGDVEPDEACAIISAPAFHVAVQGSHFDGSSKFSSSHA